MSRRRRGPRPPRRPSGKGALGAMVLTFLVALGVACRPDKWLGGGKQKGGNLGSTAGTTSGPATPGGNGAPPTAGAPATTPLGDAPSVHLALGTPTDADPSDDYLMIKPQYALSYNKDRNVANWVSSELNASWFGSAPRQKGKFLSDESLPAGWYRVKHEDYSNSGYDRGHMVRSEERTRSPEDNKATFYLTNVLPQYHDLNAGPWLRLEDYAQALAQRDRKELFVVAGGIFPRRPKTIGHGVAVPDDCFKIIVVLEHGQGARDVSAQTRVIAVIMPNVTGILDDAWGKYRTSVREIEKRTGYDFLNRVPGAVQQVIEAQVDSGPTR